MTNTERQQMRALALAHAVQVVHSGSPALVLQAAAAFYAFLVGEHPAASEPA